MNQKKKKNTEKIKGMASVQKGWTNIVRGLVPTF